MKTIIIGNGILGLTAAYALLKKDPTVNITLIGPYDNKGCASIAAAAMFNSFCELDSDTLSNPIEREKWLFNKSATPLWPVLLEELEKESGTYLEKGFGTYLINNQVTDYLEDENYEAIIEGLKEFSEPFEFINPANIPFYKPSSPSRAVRGIFIKNEGWVNPFQLTDAFKKIIVQSGRVKYVDGYCKNLHAASSKIEYAELENGEKIYGDAFLMANGANFSKIIEASNTGLQFPKIFYGIGCTILLKTDDNTLKNCVRTPNRGLACGVYSAPQDANHTVIGASNFISPVPEDGARATSVYTLLKSAMEQINSDYYRAQLAKVSVGWRPTSEDTLPLLGCTEIKNLFIATGTKRDGLHCSPIISDFISDLILTGASNHNFPMFKPDRKAVKVCTREDAIKKAVRHTINAAYQHDFVSAKNRMVEDLEKYYEDDLNKLHDKVGAYDWGIPPEMINMYRYGHIK